MKGEEGSFGASLQGLQMGGGQDLRRTLVVPSVTRC